MNSLLGTSLAALATCCALGVLMCGGNLPAADPPQAEISNGQLRVKLYLPDTGNGRRESYEHIPMPRMTNTYMLAGTDNPEDIIRSVKHGVYAVNFGGGQVDITNGKFVFSASEAYMIENGQITAPIKGATLIGNGPDVLTRVSMVGNDLKLDEGVGTCGKDGQAVPVGVGIPTLKVDRLTVGGTARKDPGGYMQ